MLISHSYSQVEAEIRGHSPEETALEMLADRRMHALFDLWDQDADGAISFYDLSLGLRKLADYTGQVLSCMRTEGPGGL